MAEKTKFSKIKHDWMEIQARLECGKKVTDRATDRQADRQT